MHHPRLSLETRIKSRLHVFMYVYSDEPQEVKSPSTGNCCCFPLFFRFETHVFFLCGFLYIFIYYCCCYLSSVWGSRTELNCCWLYHVLLFISCCVLGWSVGRSFNCCCIVCAIPIVDDDCYFHLCWLPKCIICTPVVTALTALSFC